MIKFISELIKDKNSTVLVIGAQLADRNAFFEYIETFYNTKRRHKKFNNLTILEHQKLINNNLKMLA